LISCAIFRMSLSAANHDDYQFCFFGESSSTCSSSVGSNGTVTGFSSAGVFHGTSAFAPSFAGIMAIVDQKTGGATGPRKLRVALSGCPTPTSTPIKSTTYPLTVTGTSGPQTNSISLTLTITP